MKIKSKMGRPVKPLTLPRSQRMTVNDIWALNPHIKCRLSIYTKVGRLIKTRVLRRTRETETSAGDNGVGKPLRILERVRTVTA